MPPTISDLNGEKKEPRSLERKSEIICRVKYCNTLPDVPFDLKFLQYPFDGERFVEYKPTSLERNYKSEVLTEHDLGVTIDLVNRDLYQPDGFTQLAPEDERLLEEEVLTPQDSARSRQHSRPVSWLRKSEYISTEQTRFMPQNLENIEAKVGYSVKKSLREETLYLDREAQIKAIEKTFDDSKMEITKHYSKPNVVPIEVMSIYPDFDHWKYPFAQVIFDSDPAPIGKKTPAQLEEMSQAMIRGVMDESGEQFVAYFLPTDETLAKRRRDATDNVLYKDDEAYEYKIAREYNWNVKTKASKGYEENYFFIMRNDSVYYNELETRVRLNKRRLKAGQQPNNTKLLVKHRPVDANEDRMQRYRERQLEPHGEVDDEEEDEDDDEDDAADGDEKVAKSAGKEKNEHEDDVDDENENDDNDVKKPADDDEKSVEKSAEGSANKTQANRERQSRSRSHTSSGSARSRTRSRSSNSSRGSAADNRSKSGSRSRSRSRSRSGSASGSERGSRSRSSTRSRSNSQAASGSQKSRSGSSSRSPTRSRSGTPNGSGSESPANSRAASRSQSRSRSRSASRSRSRSASASGSESGEN